MLFHSFGHNNTAVIIGASGGLGQQFLTTLSQSSNFDRIYAFSRSTMTPSSDKVICGTLNLNSEESIAKAANQVKQQGLTPSLVLITSGILHDDQTIQPEKSLKDLSLEQFHQVYAINTFGPALVAKHFLPMMSRADKAVFAALSARVGSLSDNHLGGWYAYRSSKAALNMIIKNAAIETKRLHRNLIVVGLHPGTVDTALSKPFQQRIPKDQLFLPQFSVNALAKVMDQLQPEDSGGIFAWDGSAIPY